MQPPIFDNDESGEDFASMFEKSLMRKDFYSVGDKVKGKVVAVSGDTVFLDISGKNEALLDIAELTGKDGNVTVKTGDMVEAFVMGFGSGEIRLTTKLGKSGMSSDLLQTAYEGGIPVEGVVSEIVKGGYRVLVSGSRAFCPLSQIDIKNSVPEDHIQKKYTFKITEFKENGRNIIVSRRALLEEEREKGLAELKASLKIGAVIEGTGCVGCGLWYIYKPWWRRGACSPI